MLPLSVSWNPLWNSGVVMPTLLGSLLPQEHKAPETRRVYHQQKCTNDTDGTKSCDNKEENATRWIW